jgi:hypothetical protein
MLKEYVEIFHLMVHVFLLPAVEQNCFGLGKNLHV